MDVEANERQQTDCGIHMVWDKKLELPSLHAVFATQRPLLKRIPKICRCLWAEVVAQELAEAASRKNVASWTPVRMVAKYCLWKHHKIRGE